MIPTSSPIIKLTRVPYFHPEYIPPNNLTIMSTTYPNEEPTAVRTIHTVEKNIIHNNTHIIYKLVFKLCPIDTRTMTPRLSTNNYHTGVPNSHLVSILSNILTIIPTTSSNWEPNYVPTFHPF